MEYIKFSDNTPVPQIKDLTIRQLQEKDLTALEWEGEFLHFRRLFRMVFEEAQSGNAVLWIAEYPQFGLVGQAFVQLSSHNKDLADGRNRAYIHGVRVRSQFRHRGIASLLMQASENDLLFRGYKEVVLSVARDNIIAQRLYKKLGYRIIGADAGEWSYIDHTGQRVNVKEPAWRMLKILLGDKLSSIA